MDQLPKKARDLYNKGLSAFERGSLDYAVNMFFACIELEPRFLQARKLLRAAELKKFRHESPKQGSLMIRRAASAGLYLKAKRALHSGKAEQALITAEKILRNDPLYARNVVLFVEAARASDLLEAAVHTLEVAVENLPDDGDLLQLLGKAYGESGATGPARRCLERLAELRPNDPDVIRDLKNAMALDSMSADGWNRAAEDGKTFREVMKDAHEATVLEQESKAVRSEKNIDVLIQETLQKLQAEPGNFNFYRALARLYSQKEDFESAERVLQRAVELNPGDAQIDHALTQVRLRGFDHSIQNLREEGREDEAVQLESERTEFYRSDLAERVKRYPNDLALRFEMGVALFEDKKWNEAVQQFQMAQRNPKFRAQALYHLGLCFKNKGQFDLAMAQLRTASEELVAMDDTKKDVLYEMGAICEEADQLEQAGEFFKQIYQVDIGFKDVAQRIESFYGGSTE